MKPDAVQALRAIQGSLAESLIPDLSTEFAQDAAQVLAMMAESLAAEWDRAAEDLRADNETMRSLLETSVPALRALPGRNEAVDALVIDIDGVIRGAGDGEITISSLSSNHDRLAGLVERVLCLAEDRHGEPGAEALGEVRSGLFRHLRQLAVRGWSFWDVASFRERMARTGSGG